MIFFWATAYNYKIYLENNEYYLVQLMYSPLIIGMPLAYQLIRKFKSSNEAVCTSTFAAKDIKVAMPSRFRG